MMTCTFSGVFSPGMSRIIDEAGHLTGMVNDLLDISKLQAGVTQLKKTHLNLTKNLQAAVQRIGRMASAKEFTIELICDHDEEVFVDADEFKIYQVVYNLINNSVPRQAVNSPLQFPVQNPAPISSQYHLYTPDVR